MKSDELDRAFLKDDEILPSSGFTASVMDAVREEAATAERFPPMRFPWLRAVPVLAAVAAVFITLLVAIVRLYQVSISEPSSETMGMIAEFPLHSTVLWVLIGLVFTVLSTALSYRIANGK